ncbi:hypothetical protein GY21_01930 [Cryobacterium roopkundense]|uniref:Uncharacterized protein n=1 Tax=Cryobacterium roopkundense TaxID=1001240 RepID=A0A099JRX1_9MICO|nr:hypothetical protein GY21_01930 [Cryobacterium roopkundense]
MRAVCAARDGTGDGVDHERVGLGGGSRELSGSRQDRRARDQALEHEQTRACRHLGGQCRGLRLGAPAQELGGQGGPGRVPIPVVEVDAQETGAAARFHERADANFGVAEYHGQLRYVAAQPARVPGRFENVVADQDGECRVVARSRVGRRANRHAQVMQQPTKSL